MFLDGEMEDFSKFVPSMGVANGYCNFQTLQGKSKCERKMSRSLDSPGTKEDGDGDLHSTLLTDKNMSNLPVSR